MNRQEEHWPFYSQSPTVTVSFYENHSLREWRPRRLFYYLPSGHHLRSQGEAIVE